MIEAIPIISPFVPIAVTLVELIAHAGKMIAKKSIEEGTAKGITTIFEVIDRRHRHLISRESLIALQTHFAALKDATEELANETHGGDLSERYGQLRCTWLNLFSPTLAVLHNLDPTTITELNIYSKKFGALLGNELKVTQQTLSAALVGEREEINYDTESHLCTLCLQVVRKWSEAGTMVGGLSELSVELDRTMDNLGTFIACNWPMPAR
jgi:hypothetical protein